MISAPIADRTQSWRVTQKPLRKTSKFSTSVLTGHPPPHAGDLVPVDRRGLRVLLVELAGGVLPRLHVPAVLEDLVQEVVEEGPKLLVALLQADAVRLLGERGAGELELVGVGRHVAGQ